MHKIYELKDMLCDELEEYGSKGRLDVGSLDIIDKLAHAIKNLDKIIKSYEEEEYSNAGYEDGSYARDDQGRYTRSRMSRRGMSRRGYSRDEGMVMELRELAEDAPDERTRMGLQKLINKMENMR